MARAVKDVSVGEFAQLVGLTSQRIYQLIQDGMPHRARTKAKSGWRIVPAEGVKWIRERDRADAQRTRADTQPAVEIIERARKVRAEADLKELEVLERRRLLVPMDDFTTFVEHFVGSFAAVAAGRLQRFERDMVRASSPAEARKLTQLMHTSLMAGAQEHADALDSEADAMEDASPPQDDNPSPGAA